MSKSRRKCFISSTLGYCKSDSSSFLWNKTSDSTMIVRTAQRKVRRKIQLGGAGRECEREREREAGKKPTSLPLPFFHLVFLSALLFRATLHYHVEQVSARIQNINRRAQSTSCGYKSFFCFYSIQSLEKEGFGKRVFSCRKGSVFSV